MRDLLIPNTYMSRLEALPEEKRAEVAEAIDKAASALRKNSRKLKRVTDTDDGTPIVVFEHGRYSVLILDHEKGWCLTQVLHLTYADVTGLDDPEELDREDPAA